MSELGLDLNLNIEVKVRIRVLYDVIKNLCMSFDFPEYITDTMYKGIVERQILKSVYAYYLDNEEKAVGMVRFNIDWEKHNMYAETDTGKEIEIREDIPLVDQFANWARDIIFYVKEMQKELNVKNVIVYYRYRDEIRNDAVKNAEADKYLGLHKSNRKIEYSNEKSEKFVRNMKFVSEMLPELEIELKSNV